MAESCLAQRRTSHCLAAASMCVITKTYFRKGEIIRDKKEVKIKTKRNEREKKKREKRKGDGG